MDMNLMLIIVQENDAESLASAFKRSQIQATRNTLSFQQET